MEFLPFHSYCCLGFVTSILVDIVSTIFIIKIKPRNSSTMVIGCKIYAPWPIYISQALSIQYLICWTLHCNFNFHKHEKNLEILEPCGMTQTCNIGLVYFSISSFSHDSVVRQLMCWHWHWTFELCYFIQWQLSIFVMVQLGCKFLTLLT